jgi:hypothetical protein
MQFIWPMMDVLETLSVSTLMFGVRRLDCCYCRDSCAVHNAAAQGAEHPRVR